MSNINGIRGHMKSIQQTVKISNAQKLIAGSKINKAHKVFEKSQAYHNRIKTSVSCVLKDCEVKSKYVDTGEKIKKHGLLVISADKGLAGAYSQNLIKTVHQLMEEETIVKIMAAGLLGHKNFHEEIVDDFTCIVENPTLATAEEIAEHMIKMYENGIVDCFDVIYTHFKSALHMVPVIERLFPLPINDIPVVHFAEYDPSPDIVLQRLVPKYVKGFIFGCLTQAWICELSSRVSAMENAIKNGNEMLNKLSLQYNRVRQGDITREITEIVASASAMEEA